MTLYFLNDAANDVVSKRKIDNYVIIASLKSEPTCKPLKSEPTCKPLKSEPTCKPLKSEPTCKPINRMPGSFLLTRRI